jgi:hypothetical protein
MNKTIKTISDETDKLMGWPQPPPVDRAVAAAVEKSRGGGHVQCRFGILSDTAQGQSQLAASIIIIIIIMSLARQRSGWRPRVRISISESSMI